jgi:hypothetical protein
LPLIADDVRPSARICPPAFGGENFRRAAAYFRRATADIFAARQINWPSLVVKFRLDGGIIRHSLIILKNILQT